MKIQVKVRNESAFPLPSYQTSGSAGMDLRANIAEEVLLGPLQRQLVPTGLFIELPEGHEAQVRPRSGLAFKHGLTVLNSPGTVDSDYRGEIKIILINLSREPQQVNDGDRIAQLVFQKVEKVNLVSASELTTSERAEGGFGHTGKK